MNRTQRKRLDLAVTSLQRRWGTRVVIRAREVQPESRVILTRVPELDRHLGGGIPLGAITLFSGQTTSGKLTLAYKILHGAQHSSTTTGTSRLQPVAVLDLNATTDPDYGSRCGIDLDYLLLVRPQVGNQAIDVLVDLVRSRQLRAILLDGLPDLRADAATARYLDQLLPQLSLLLKSSGCALIVLDELQPPWLGWFSGTRSSAIDHYAALHVEIKRERWIESGGELRGYQVQARTVKSQRARPGQVARLAITFGETVRARETW